MALQPRPPDMAAAAAAAVACRNRLPPMREAGQLLAAMERCCRSWRQALADIPLHISLGPLPLPPNPEAALLRQIGAAGRRRLQALHFEAPAQRGQKPGKVQLLAVELLALEAFSAAAGDTLTELAVFDYLCSQPLCALLPRYAALRRLALSGYAVQVNLEPLRSLPRLEELSLESEGLPKSLSALPPSLRRLSLSSFVNGGRLLLPEHVRLDSLMCCCPGQPVFFGLSRALSVCRSIHVCGATVHMLLSVRSGGSSAPAATLDSAPAAAAAALVSAFARSATAQHLELGYERQLVLKLTSKDAREPGGVGPFPPAQRGQPLHVQLVLAAAAAAEPAVLASLQPMAQGSASAAEQQQQTRLVLSKPGAAT
ncbi:hypothetical protein COHA_000710 [Chlorella ohadii]|uniref:Uncharacterized protein n=1 Tax=Chlorella ohadii TaxID=2649997 RepID=A0AAD5DZS1_9CHLO|nr:hypothetical protein COHA_000710 [Chlorella ohadii]